MREVSELSEALSAVDPVEYERILYRRVPLVSLLGIRKKASGLHVTRLPPQFLYAGGGSGRVNRYTYPGGPDSLYLAEDEETARAEATPDGLELPPTVVFSVQAKLSSVLDLTAKDVQVAVGTTSEELRAPLLYKPAAPRLPSHTLAEAVIISARFSAIRYPSARLAAGVCLVVYPDHLKEWEELRLIDPSGIFSEESRAREF
jgi:RES domain-containing protein